MKESIRIKLWDQEIGRLEWDRRSQRCYFTYNPEFLRTAKYDPAPLTASVRGLSAMRPVFSDRSSKYQHLPPFLSDSLPDEWGSQLFQQWCAEQRIPAYRISPLDKLSFIGRRGMGALEFEPDVEFNECGHQIELKSLVALAQHIFSERSLVSISPDQTLTMNSLIAVGTSAGGRQPKAIIAIDKSSGEIRSGQVAGLDGFDYCILKFGDSQRSSAELEMVYYDMARRAGISMMESDLFMVDGQNHFLTHRFDRMNGTKLHTQTLAALCPDTTSYEELLRLCRRMRFSENECTEIFRRMVFNHLANNTDDHDKNFSFIMDRNGHWSLAPAYDMTFIFNKRGFLAEDQHCLLMCGKTSGVTREDALLFAAENGIKNPEQIIKNVAESIALFPELAQKYGVHKEWLDRVWSTLQSHLLDWGFISGNADEEFNINSHIVVNPHIEQAYRGNLHLVANIDGSDKKYIFRKGTETYNLLLSIGISQISKDLLKELIQQYLIK